MAGLNVAGVIVAGGAGRRMGAEKPLMPFRGGVLLDAVIARVRPQVDRLALNVPAESLSLYRARYGAAQVLLGDAAEGRPGPLAGVALGLDWLAREGMAEWLATFPCDTPFLPAHLVAALGAGRIEAGARPVVIRAEGEVQSLCALWPRAAFGPLRDGLASGAFRSVRDALGALRALVVDDGSPPGAYFNVNTPEDLAEAERRGADGAAGAPA